MKKIIVLKHILLCIMILASYTNIYADDTIDISPTEPPQDIIYWDGGIEIIPPYKTIYNEGEFLDVTGLEVYTTSGIHYKIGNTVVNKVTRREKCTNVIIDLINKPLTTEDTFVTVKGWYSMFNFPIPGEFQITVNPSSSVNSQASLQFVDIVDEVLIGLEGGMEVRARSIYSACENENVNLYMTLYNQDGVLQEAVHCAQTVSANETITLTTESICLPQITDGLYLKAFLWDDNLRSLHSIVEIK